MYSKVVTKIAATTTWEVRGEDVYPTTTWVVRGPSAMLLELLAGPEYLAQPNADVINGPNGPELTWRWLYAPSEDSIREMVSRIWEAAQKLEFALAQFRRFYAAIEELAGGETPLGAGY